MAKPMDIINRSRTSEESLLGWIACGKLKESEITQERYCFLTKNDSLQDTLKLFFDLEGLGIKDDPILQENDQAMKIFNETVEFKDGRYIVQLPFRKDYNELADNYSLAKQRFRSLWKRFTHDPDLYDRYREIIQDYTSQGIIEIVKPDSIQDECERPIFYLPHMAVKKESLTTSLRIVFDAAAHEVNELSLNDCLWPGPNLNPNLLDVLIEFRLNRTAFCSDVKQAFLQIGLAEVHKDAVRFFWSNDEPSVSKDPKLIIFHFNRVNFGVNSSPFLLAATIRHHIKKYENDLPVIVQLLDRNLYVDDFISGSNDFDEALEISRDANKIIEAAGMTLRKWITNDADLMEQWKNEGLDTHPANASVSLGSNQTKVLGLLWNTSEDYFSVDTRSLLKFVSSSKSTKRSILQAIGKIFDPLGLISCFTIRMKCLIQELWSEKIPWDESLPPKIEKEWIKWCEEIPFLENLKIPRLVLNSISKEDIVEIHSFCDASKNAYGATVYLKVYTPNGPIVRLLTSKSRVAPLNSVTLPRLELLGALVAARLTSKVKKIVNLKRSSIAYHWTDSKIALYWIKGKTTRWKQFVANRVKEIATLTDPNSWHHCAGTDNPADILSRGISAECLVDSSRWWTGAEFLMESDFQETLEQSFPDIESLAEGEKETILREAKTVSSTESTEETVLLTDDSQTLIDKLLELSNNYYKINHILCYICRFLHNCKHKDKKMGPLTVDEVKYSESILIKHSQKTLVNKNNFSRNISSLNPFVDGDGLIRVGGRLDNASVPFDQKHQIILPKKSKLSKIYFDSLHRKLLHIGPQGLLSAVRLKFWPLGGRNLARQTVHQCVTCFKSKPFLSTQIMGNLPSERVNMSPPFSVTGVDLCGPFAVKYKHQRKGTLNKVYICIFICFSTKAIHLEQLTDLTSDSMIATLKRFTSRRGKCSKIYTDNATNFVGANSQLKKFYGLINFPDQILANYFTSEGIEWNFIPPKSPHFGGLWEAGVKSVKHHLKRAVGKFHFTYEEMETIVIQIEGILNSRPLCPLSGDNDSFDVLTPGHFLIGRPITSIVEPNLTDLNDNRLSRWQKTTKVVQLIWEKWKSDYLNTLQARSKWMVTKNDLKIGQMVLVKEDFLPLNTWILGRIIYVYHGSDNKVRVVKIRTKSGVFKRAVSKIAVLPIDT
nr:uncharacterized protein LOC122271644 [Parasteatoda tepidariorum]